MKRIAMLGAVMTAVAGLVAAEPPVPRPIANEAQAAGATPADVWGAMKALHQDRLIQIAELPEYFKGPKVAPRNPLDKFFNPWDGFRDGGVDWLLQFFSYNPDAHFDVLPWAFRLFPRYPGLKNVLSAPAEWNHQTGRKWRDPYGEEWGWQGTDQSYSRLCVLWQEQGCYWRLIHGKYRQEYTISYVDRALAYVVEATLTGQTTVVRVDDAARLAMYRRLAELQDHAIALAAKKAGRHFASRSFSTTP